MEEKSGYNTDEQLLNAPINNSVSLSEQEVVINMMRDEESAKIYTSDTTYMTKLDRLCKESPDMYSLIADTGRGKTYLLQDKSLISFRKAKKVLSEEQRLAASNRFKKMWSDKSN